MHAAKLGTSSRLQRVMRVLSDGQEHSTREIIRRAHVGAVSSIAAELRVNGISISCRQRTDESGQRIFVYRLGT